MKPFQRGLTIVGEWVGHPGAFVLVAMYGLGWLTFGGGLDWHGVATLTTAFLTLFILRTDRRQTQALQAKLDELLRASANARNAFADVDQKEPEEIERLRQRHREPGSAS